MFGHTDARRFFATVFAALLMSSMAIGTAVGPAQPVTAEFA